MRFAVFGVGGTGGYFGGRLAEAGEEVHFIARGAHREQIRAAGLRVESIKGDFTAIPASVTDDPATIGPVDCVLLGVKSWQVRDAARAIGPLVGPNTRVLPTQNGVEAPGELTAILPRENVLGGVAKIIASIVGPGHIRHVGQEPILTFGSLAGSPDDRAVEIQRAFARVKGVTSSIATDINVTMWEKFVFIAAWGGVGAVTRMPIGVIRTVAPTRRMLESVMTEIAAVGRAHGVALGADLTARTMAFADALPAAGTTSMQRDLFEGRRSELEAWNGAGTRLGAAVGVPTPVNDLIYHALLPSELRARGEIP